MCVLNHLFKVPHGLILIGNDTKEKYNEKNPNQTKQKRTKTACTNQNNQFFLAMEHNSVGSYLFQSCYFFIKSFKPQGWTFCFYKIIENITKKRGNIDNVDTRGCERNGWMGFLKWNLKKQRGWHISMSSSFPVPHPYPSKWWKEKGKRLRDWMLSSSIRREQEINESREPRGATSVRNLSEFPLAIKRTQWCRNILLLLFFYPPKSSNNWKTFSFFLQNKIKTFFLRNKFFIVLFKFI